MLQRLGASLVKFTKRITGAVQRTQADINNDLPLFISDFFIAGEADWTYVFKRAARASADSGKPVRVPAGTYLVSDSIPLYDQGYGAVPEPDVQSYYKGNGTKFIGDGRKTIIRKTGVSTKDVNAVFYIDSSNAVPSENGKRGMRIQGMSIIDLTPNSVGIYNNKGVVCTHFQDLFIMARRVGVWVGGSFVDVHFQSVIVQGHDDHENYPLEYGFRVGSGTGTSITMDSCHVGSATKDAYEIKAQYSKIGVLSADNCLGIVYVFDEFRGSIQSLGSEWSGELLSSSRQNGTFMRATNSQMSIGLVSMLGKYSNSQLFDFTGSQVKIDQVNATDNCVFLGSPARLRKSAALDIGYFTQYKFEQFPKPVDYDAATNTHFTYGKLAGTQYRGQHDISIHGNLMLPHAQIQGECYRIMGTKSVAAQSGCMGTLYSLRGRELTRAALMMDVVVNGNGNIGTSAHAVKRAVSDPVGLKNYTGWYEAKIGTTVYLMLKMDANGEQNLGCFFSGVTIGRDPNLFRIVTPNDVTDIVPSSIGTVKVETAA